MSAKKLAERLLAIVERFGDLPVYPDLTDDDDLHTRVDTAVMMHADPDDVPPGLHAGDPYVLLMDPYSFKNLYLAEDAIHLEWRGPKLPLCLNQGQLVPWRGSVRTPLVLARTVKREQQADGRHIYVGESLTIPADLLDWSHPSLAEYCVLESNGGPYHQRASKAMDEAVQLGSVEAMSLAGYWLSFVEQKDPK